MARRKTSAGKWVDSDTAGGSGSAAVSVSGSDIALVAANADRTAVTICNDHATQIVYLAFGTTAVINQGIRLNAAGGTITITWWTGAIRAIASGASTVVTYIDV